MDIETLCPSGLECFSAIPKKDGKTPPHWKKDIGEVRTTGSRLCTKNHEPQNSGAQHAELRSRSPFAVFSSLQFLWVASNPTWDTVREKDCICSGHFIGLPLQLCVCILNHFGSVKKACLPDMRQPTMYS